MFTGGVVLRLHGIIWFCSIPLWIQSVVIWIKIIQARATETRIGPNDYRMAEVLVLARRNPFHETTENEWTHPSHTPPQPPPTPTHTHTHTHTHTPTPRPIPHITFIIQTYVTKWCVHKIVTVSISWCWQSWSFGISLKRSKKDDLTAHNWQK